MKRAAAQNRWISLLARVAALAVVLAPPAGCSGDAAAEGAATGAGSAPPPPVVHVAVAAEEALVPGGSYVGRLQVVDRVEVRAQVTGTLVRRAFEEGSRVEAGALLFEIDPAPFAAAVDAAAAELAAAEARHRRATQYLERVRAAEGAGIAPAELESAEGEAAEAAAHRALAEAELRRAEIDLGYTEIRSPIDGYIGRAYVSAGNLVGPGVDPGESASGHRLAFVVSMDPIHVTFRVPERFMLEARLEMIAAGGRRPDYVPRLTLSNGAAYPHAGKIDYVEGFVDPETGTLMVRALVPNPDRLLLPGESVTVELERDDAPLVVLVPQRAVLRDDAGAYVLVVGPDDTVERRAVVPGVTVGARSALEEGLAAGERVVVEGVQKVGPGMRVRPRPARGSDG